MKLDEALAGVDRLGLDTQLFVEEPTKYQYDQV